MGLKIFRLIRNALLVIILSGGSLQASVNVESIDHILKNAGLQSEHLGIVIEDNSEVVFSLNPERRMVPASLTKIVTAAAAFELLNPQYQFRTQLLTDGVRKGDLLEGSLYIKGGGDPSFTAGKLPALIRFLSTQGIRCLKGNVIIDNSRFDDPIFDTSAQVKHLIQSWDRKGYPLFLNFEPARQFSARLERAIRSVTTPKRDRDFVVYCNMNQPDLWTGYKFLSYLRTAGIEVSGSVERGVSPPQAKLITEVRSPLADIISQMMKASSNYYAEMLTRNLAVTNGQTSATSQEGINKILEFMDHVGIARSDYLIRSAAGFSNQNSISALNLSKVLNHMKEEKAIFWLFKNSFAIAGVDGTLKYRMKHTPAQQKVFAKTGYLKQIVGLAGYAAQADGRLITFVFMYNGPRSAHTVQNAFDRLCVELVQHTVLASARITKS